MSARPLLLADFGKGVREVRRTSRPFRHFRDPSRKHFGFIDSLSVHFVDGTSECMTVARFNRGIAKARRSGASEARP